MNYYHYFYEKPSGTATSTSASTAITSAVSATTTTTTTSKLRPQRRPSTQQLQAADNDQDDRPGPSDNYTPKAAIRGRDSAETRRLQPEPQPVGGAGTIGQLVLSVDFVAPPTSISVGLGGHQQSAEACKRLAGGQAIGQHFIEASLCIKQREEFLESPPQPPANQSQQQQQQPHQHQCPTDEQLPSANPPAKCDTRCQRAPKRRLVYERFDRFFIELDYSLLCNASSATLGNPNSSANVRLPMRPSSVDACFCFNLLNVRVASSRLLALEQVAELEAADFKQTAANTVAGGSSSGERTGVRPSDDVARRELEENWLKMERLTTELRVGLLAELARIVRKNGKCSGARFVCVLVCVHLSRLVIYPLALTLTLKLTTTSTIRQAK